MGPTNGSEDVTGNMMDSECLVPVLSTWKNLGGPCDNDPYSKESVKRFKCDLHRYLVENYFRHGSLKMPVTPSAHGWIGGINGCVLR